jgi:NAD(P)-dependent dehydrogenase (short-subunit alcohol dehydrogenase family)
MDQAISPKRNTLMRSTDNLARALGRGYFRGRTMLVTGASSGIGRDVATTFAGMGARVALLARRKSLLNDLAEQIRAEDGDAFVLSADVTKPADTREATRLALAEFGHIDILVNSAGVLEAAPVESMNPAALERMLAVNLFGTLHAIQAALPSMRKAGSGHIVNIASLAGRRGMPPLGGYCASKFAVVGLSEALRVELYGSGIRLSLVMPGVIDTPMNQGAGAPEAFKGLAASMYAMPTQWVTWAVIAALVLGLTEVDVPPGAAVAEKIAALFPGLTDAALALGNRVLEWTSRRKAGE